MLNSFFTSAPFLLRLIVCCTSLSVTCEWALAQRNLKDIPDPDPELERKTFILPEGFEVNLWAADPHMAKPIQMNFDGKGRLWVASSEVYPHIKPGQVANDKVLVLEDTNGDGKADKTTVFADGLLIPTGIAPGDGGAYVANSTELIHLKDTNGDGRADARTTVLSGFGTEDTHHLLHTLRWGHDGCLYMNQSIYIHSHVETPYGVKRLNGGGIWRFRPETLELDILCRGFVNTWGHHFDRWGNNFATDGAYGEGINYVFPGAVYVTAPGEKRFVAGLNPGSPKHCGLEIASGRHIPPEWDGSMLTNDFRAHRVCRFKVTEDGSGFSSKQEVEVIKSNHPAFRPIDVKMGPDGAIYIADWYNPIIQHGEVDFRDPRRDHVHGRIWRVTAKGRATLELPNLISASTRELFEQLRASEEWVRLHAKLALKARGADQVLEPLSTWVASLQSDSAADEACQLEALWLYQTLNSVNEKLLAKLLKSNDHRVRAAAMRVASVWLTKLTQGESYLRAGIADPHPRVRLEAVRGMSQILTLEACTQIASVLDHPVDRFLDFAVWRALRDMESVWLPAVRDGSFDFHGKTDQLTFALKATDAPGIVAPLLALIQQNKIAADRVEGVLALVASLGGPKELNAVLTMVLDDKNQLSASTKTAMLNGLIETTIRRKVQPDGDLNRISPLLESKVESIRAAAIRATGAWKIHSLQDRLESWSQLDEKKSNISAAVRLAAIDGLALLGGEKSVKILRELSSLGNDAPIRVKAVNSLSTLDTKLAAEKAVEMLSESPVTADPAVIVASLVSQKSGAAALSQALNHQKLAADTAKLLLRAVQGAPNPSPQLIATVQKVGNLGQAGWKLNPELLQQLVAEAASKGNAHRGEEVYRRKSLQCMKCHAIGGAGGRVGPDFVSLGASAQPDYLVESLIEPTKKVKENYHSKLVVTDEGKVISGIPIRETEKEVVLRDAEDRQITIGRSAIEEMKDGRSLMPDGAVDALTREELVDLVRFLSELGKVGGEFTIGPARVVRRWEVLAATPEAHKRLNRSSYDTAATNDSELLWEPAYSRVSGALPLDTLPTFVVHRGNNPVTFVRFQFEVTAAGEVRFAIPNTAGISLWLNGKPTPLQTEITATLGIGVHTLTLAIDREVKRDSLRVELIDFANGAKAQIVTGK